MVVKRSRQSGGGEASAGASAAAAAPEEAAGWRNGEHGEDGSDRGTAARRARNSDPRDMEEGARRGLAEPGGSGIAASQLTTEELLRLRTSGQAGLKSDDGARGLPAQQQHKPHQLQQQQLDHRPAGTLSYEEDLEEQGGDEGEDVFEGDGAFVENARNFRDCGASSSEEDEEDNEMGEGGCGRDGQWRGARRGLGATGASGVVEGFEQQSQLAGGLGPCYGPCYVAKRALPEGDMTVHWTMTSRVSSRQRLEERCIDQFTGTLMLGGRRVGAITVAKISPELLNRSLPLHTATKILESHSEELGELAQIFDLSRGQLLSSVRCEVGNRAEISPGPGCACIYIISVEVDRSCRGLGLGLLMVDDACAKIADARSLTILRPAPLADDSQSSSSVTRGANKLRRYYGLLGFRELSDDYVARWGGHPAPTIFDVCPHFAQHGEP